MIPTLGRVVLYILTAGDADAINRCRTSEGSIFNRVKEELWPQGAQAHIGNNVSKGDVCAAEIVRVWGSPAGATEGTAVNLQVKLDGNDVYWATSRCQGTNEGQWQEPQAYYAAQALGTNEGPATGAPVSGEVGVQTVADDPAEGHQSTLPV